MWSRITKVLKNRKKILEGVYYSLFPNRFVEAVSHRRRSICESNECGRYDVKGAEKICYIKGSPCCSSCGCDINLKTRSLSSYCSLADEGKIALWDAIMTQEDEDNYRKKHGIPE